LKTLTDIEEKEKKEKNCVHLKSGSHIWRTKIGEATLPSPPVGMLRICWTQFSNSVWSRWCTHAVIDIQCQLIKGGKFYTDLSTQQIEITNYWSAHTAP
jgi:hypothetical protein